LSTEYYFNFSPRKGSLPGSTNFYGTDGILIMSKFYNILGFSGFSIKISQIMAVG
jgi:hypothetical protein